MLKNICDVLNFYAAEKESCESIADHFFCRSKGEDSIDASVAAALGLPKAYCDFCSTHRLKGVQIGFVWFFQRNRASATDALVDMNRVEARLPGLEGYVTVGGAEGDPVLLRKGAAGLCGDTVYVADISTGPAIHIREAARTFEEFVILAANIHAEAIKENPLPAPEFMSRLKSTFPDLPDSMLVFWKSWYPCSS